MTRPDRLKIVSMALGLFAAALVVRAGYVQLWQGHAWARRADRQHFADAGVPAPRGRILDATGFPLAESRELVQLRVAPREVAEKNGTANLRAALAKAGVSAEWIAKATDERKPWVEIPRGFLPGDVARVTAIWGVHPVAIMERIVAPSQSLRRLVGHLSDEGKPLDGVERALDSLLAGVKGSTAVARDAHGDRLASPETKSVLSRQGQSVTLTINHSVQDIAERALADAMRNTGASGGDIVVMEPTDGALLALASARPYGTESGAVTAFTEPYEPGSTLKPFVAAKLLELNRARAEEVMNVFGGQFKLDGRTITDVHRANALSLRDVIKFSSNIGIVRFAARLSKAEEYGLLHDAGFGAKTGATYPVESPGRLPASARWSNTTPASLVMGYELMVTPVQLAAAYAAFANGGELVKPALVREIRDPDGHVTFRHQRTVVRRLMPERIAAQVRTMLHDVVDGGTAAGADLSVYTVAGKSGTARRTEHGRYVAGAYTASFVGLFPADHPQYVILVKLDNPRDGYFGGKVAAPVFKQVAEGAIAARDASLDLGQLAQSAKVVRTDSAAVPAPAVAALTNKDTGAVPYVVRLGAAQPPAAPAPPQRPVPDVRGLPVRGAVLALHQAGFRVQVVEGEAAATLPAAGAMLRTGSLVRLVAAR